MHEHLFPITTSSGSRKSHVASDGIVDVRDPSIYRWRGVGHRLGSEQWNPASESI